jgi:dihydroflavonol-4-reductase
VSAIVAVTGATGFIGRHLVAALAARGVQVRAIVRPRRGPAALEGATVVTAPLERTPLAEAFRGADQVVHLAGVVSSARARDYTDVNVTGAREVAAAAREAGARLVHVSSLAAAGPSSLLRPRREHDQPDPITPYGRSKLEGERAVQAIPGLRWTILRPGVVYGPGDRAMLPLFRWVARGVAPLVGRRDAAYTLVHVDDVVRAILAATADAATGDVLFVGHPTPATGRQVLDAIQAALGRHAAVVPVPAALVHAAALAGEAVGRLSGRPSVLNRSRDRELFAVGFVCSVERLRERLGLVAAVDVPQGFRATASWYRAQGWI